MGPTTCGYYGYAADGKRAYKMTGTCSAGSVNNGTIFVDCFFDDYVLYPNSYMTITPKYYTKHYFAGAERIATAIGGGGFGNMTMPPVNLTNDELYWNDRLENRLFGYPQDQVADVENVDIHDTVRTYLQYQDTRIELDEFNVDYASGSELCYLLNDELHKQSYDDEVYYYHPDHLGGAAWMTDKNGMPVQYLHYGPYGEIMENQAPYGYDERFTFTGKERDEETGYLHFDARNFSDILGNWLSVDPLADKYPWISPYAYCGWNPVKYVDLDGMYFDDANEVIAQKIEAECQNKLSFKTNNYYRRKELNKTLQDIADMRNDKKHEYRFELDKDSPWTTCNEEEGVQVITMYSNIEELDETTAHEARHGGQVARGEMFYDNKNQLQDYDINKEIDAYRAQWGWRGQPLVIPIDDGHPYPVPANARYLNITKDFIKSITVSLLDLTKLYNFH